MIVIISKGNLIKFVAAPLGMLALGFGLFNGVFFYNEAGFMTHVRTIFGDEKIVDDVGYATKWFGRATTWKKAISVQSVLVMDDNDTNPDNDGLGATIEASRSCSSATRRQGRIFRALRLPGGEPFLKMAQEYRNPDNFIRTALVPAIKETLQATASLMSADDYYAGARSEFAAEFENQLNDGLYLIKRKESVGRAAPFRTRPRSSRPAPSRERSATTTPASSSPRRSPMPRASRYASNSSSASSASRWWKRGSPTSIPTRSTSSAWSRSSRRSPSWRWRGRTA